MQETASHLLGKYFKKPHSQKQNVNSKNEHPLIIKFTTDPYMGTRVESSINAKIDHSMNHIELPKEHFILVLQAIDKIESFENTIEDYKNSLHSKNQRINDLSSELEQAKIDLVNARKEYELEKQVLESHIKALNTIIDEKNTEVSNYKNLINEKNSYKNSLEKVFSFYSMF